MFTSSGFPNMFMSLAANSVFAHGSLIPALDLGVDYMLRAAKRMSEEGIKSMSLKQEAWEEFDAYQREFNKRTVWETPCKLNPTTNRLRLPESFHVSSYNFPTDDAFHRPVMV